MVKRTLIPSLAVAAFAAALPAAADTTSAQHEPGVVSESPVYTKSMERLTEAAQKFRESIRTLAQEPPGPDRDMSMRAARKALLDTQQAMIDLPPRMRTRSGPENKQEYGQAPNTILGNQFIVRLIGKPL